MGEIKRTLKTMPNFKTNSPRDFFHFDYSLSYFLPETQGRIEAEVSGLYARIGKILDDDRKKAKEAEPGVAAGQGFRERKGVNKVQFVANLKFQNDEAELERLYNEYKKAKGNFILYLQKEGINFGEGEFIRKGDSAKTASGN